MPTVNFTKNLPRHVASEAQSVGGEMIRDRAALSDSVTQEAEIGLTQALCRGAR